MPNGVGRQVVKKNWEDRFMRKSASRVFCCFLGVVLCWMFVFNFAYAAVQIPSVTTDFFVNDFANVFTADDKAKLLETSNKMTEYNDIKFIVSTVETLDGNNIEKYAESMYNKYLGEDGFGALILLVTDEKKVQVEVGHLIKPYVDKAEIERIIEEYARERVENGEFGSAMIDLQKWLINHIMNEAFFPVLEDMNGEFTDNSARLKTMNVLIAIGYVMCVLLLSCSMGLIIIKLKRK